MWTQSIHSAHWADLTRMVARAPLPERVTVAKALTGCRVMAWTATAVANLYVPEELAPRIRSSRSLRAAQERIWAAPEGRRRDLAAALDATGVLLATIEAVCGVRRAS